MKDWASLLGFPTPRELYRGVWNEEVLQAIQLDPGRMEGYVVRVTDSIRYEEFSRKVAKWVRRGHVQTDQHWLSKPVEPNGLRSGSVRK